MAEDVGFAGLFEPGLAHLFTGRLADLIRQPPSEEMRQAGFEQARKSDIFRHKSILTDLWAPVLSPRPLVAA